jgi:hypothetical protein
MMAAVADVTTGSQVARFQAAWLLLDWVYLHLYAAVMVIVADVSKL